ncbi:MAG: EamA family transporter [Eikenella sp.]|nr:EamA family transporter [Eikenella sp.]
MHTTKPHSAALPLPHILLALAVALVWGSNFVVIKLGLAQLPPLLFAALRFALAAVPLVLFLPRPPVPWRNLAAYGLAIGLGTFGLLFLAMNRHISPGLASLVIQAQVFFTIGLVIWQTGERPPAFQMAAMILAAAGMGLIIARTEGDTTALGVALVLLAALSWALGNLVGRAAGPVNALAYVAWSSLFAVPPLLGLSLWLEGAPRIAAALAEADAAAWAAVLWQSLGNTVFGYGAWAWLLARHPAASITPFALLVPLSGMGASALLLGETLPGWKLAAAALVLAGLALNVLCPRLSAGRQNGANSA